MAPSGDQKRRSSIAKILFTFGFGGGAGSSSSSSSAPAGANHKFMASDVGLGIIASMIDDSWNRTGPLPVAGEKRRLPTAGEIVDEQSETYTCVIAYREGQPVRKRVYYGDAAEVRDKLVPFELSPPPQRTPPHSADFLSQCFRCKGELRGKDIYMYRAEAFCSEGCRGKAIVLDELERSFRRGGKTAKKIDPPPLRS
ncbi:FCS-Like Zinc finger 13-like [Zingiber officinale]|uniref:FCS-Like Zinc finger 13-like n=1 Tax=Zingiber officinale TaxID=94328 RepID=UPI001C4D5059|nr:FCS-Like Zinc finger 13-like [Zingiber officinale]